MVSKSKQSIRTRIAPSPTGYLHIGTARTALFNWLFARHHGGQFILRIEDTDLERSDKKFEADILESLIWLGLNWDEGPTAGGSLLPGSHKGEFGPYRQSERLETYAKYIGKLLKENLAYYCFCTKEELEEERQVMLTQGLAPKYSGKCGTLTAPDVKKRLADGDSHVIRFRMPATTVLFKDLIRGPISFDTGLMGDITIAKDPTVPLYNFAVVVDDYEMEITHVIRGEDHIANTPKQILIQKALGFSQPEYAHLPLILDLDRSKMSKRFSATAVTEYRRQGYLPDALVNFMAFLGWHPKKDREILSREELIKEFDLGRAQKSGAVFNIDKLNWTNSQYIKHLSDDRLAELLGVDNLKIIPLVRDRMVKLSDFKELADWFSQLPDYLAGTLIWKQTSQEVILKNLSEAIRVLNNGEAKDLMALAEKRGRGEVLWPIRVALSGKEASPGPIQMAEVLGKEETIRRINIAIEKLEARK